MVSRGPSEHQEGPHKEEGQMEALEFSHTREFPELNERMKGFHEFHQG
jgi:hypothetical protein